jgi:hypothetical protein
MLASGVNEQHLLALLRVVVVGALAGLVTGLLVGGVGSRLAMRLVVLATDRLPRLTIESLFVLILGTFAGITLGLLFVGIRRWLPGAWWFQGLAFGLGLLVVLGIPFFVEGISHSDSELREGPLPLGIGLFSLLFIAFGLVVAASSALLERLLPIPRRPAAVLAYGVVALVGGAAGLLGLAMILMSLAGFVASLTTGRAF